MFSPFGKVDSSANGRLCESVRNTMKTEFEISTKRDETVCAMEPDSPLAVMEETGPSAERRGHACSPPRRSVEVGG